MSRIKLIPIAVFASLSLAACSGDMDERQAKVTEIKNRPGERMEPLADGEELLFSPACASFDAFLNFKERAAAFRAALPEPDGGASAPGTESSRASSSPAHRVPRGASS